MRGRKSSLGAGILIAALLAANPEPALANIPFFAVVALARIGVVGKSTKLGGKQVRSVP